VSYRETCFGLEALVLKGIALLLGFQAAGELARWLLNLPISGAVCGMALLLLWLVIRGKAPEDLTRVTDGLLANMPILFVPVGAGAIVYIDVFQQHWPAIALGVLAGTAITLTATAMAVRYMSAKRRSAPTRAIGEAKLN
jgi:holin-like protein